MVFVGFALESWPIKVSCLELKKLVGSSGLLVHFTQNMVSDPIADLLFRIKNAYLADKKAVSVPYSKVKESLAKLLLQKGFVEKVKIRSLPRNPKLKTIEISLKYKDKKPALTDVKRVSKPGVRIFVKKEKMLQGLSGLGTVILSTPQGLMTRKEARKRGLGGEVVCEIW